MFKKEKGKIKLFESDAFDQETKNFSIYGHFHANLTV